MMDVKLEFIEIPNHQFHTILSHLSKNHLIMICQALKVRNVTNKRKSDLQSIIHSDIYLYIKRYLTLMNETHITVLSELLFEEDPHKRMEISKDHLMFFTSLGIAYPICDGNIKTFIVPKEIKKFLYKLMNEELVAQIKRNNEVIALATACTSYYGLMNYQKFYQVYQQQHPNDELLYDIKDLLELEAQFNHSFICEYDYFYDLKLSDGCEQLLKIRKQNNFAFYSYDLFHTNEEIHFITRQDLKIQNKLAKLNKKFQPYRAKIDWILNLLDKGYSLDWIKETEEVSQKVFKQLEKIHPYLRLWCYKGNRFIDLK